MSMRVLFASLTALLLSNACSAQQKKPAVDEKLVGEWKVSLVLDSEPSRGSGSTTFERFRVSKDGACELVGTMDSDRAEYRHRDFATVGTLGVPDKDGVMELDLEFASQGKGSGKVVWRGIAKRDGAVLLIALGRGWSDARPKSFDGVMAAAHNKPEAKHATLIVLGVDRK
jgi:hypothetical protein